MPRSHGADGETDGDDPEERIHEEYVLDVRIVAVEDDGDRRYRFEAPDHVGKRFDDPELATLYAAVYFDANGFAEAGTGDRGVPPEVIQCGRDTLIAYFKTQEGVDRNWLASFYGEKPGRIDGYLSRVRDRAAEIRERIAERELE